MTIYSKMTDTERLDYAYKSILEQEFRLKCYNQKISRYQEYLKKDSVKNTIDKYKLNL